jgi:hypothetical protein
MATETASVHIMDTRRDFIISNLPRYIQVAPLGQNRKCSMQVGYRSNTKKPSYCYIIVAVINWEVHF